MGQPFTSGEPAIKVLDVDGVTVLRTVYLPPPNKNGGVVLSFDEVGNKVDLYDGSKRSRILGYLPKLKLSWKVYDDVTARARKYGPSDGARARLQDLLLLLAMAPGALLVSPGPGDPAVITATDQGFGVGDGLSTSFQLQETVGKGIQSWGIDCAVPQGPVTNYMARSREFDQAVWTKINGGTGVAPVVTPNYGLAPDGTFTADRLVCTNGAGATGSDYSVVKQGMSPTLPPTSKTTRSIWVKSNTGASQSASLGSNGNAVLKTITTEWQRIDYTYAHPTLALAHTLDFGLVGSVAGNTNATLDVLVWEGQLEEGDVATPNITTKNVAVTRYPSYYGARTNMGLYSQDFGNAAWTKFRCTITGSAIAGPSENSFADALVEDNTTNTHPLRQTIAGMVAGGTYTSQVKIKPAGRTQARLQLSGTAFPASPYVDVDFTAGTVTGGAGGSGHMEALANGWYRVWVTGDATVTGTGDIYINPMSAGTTNYLGTSIVAFYLDDYQHELGPGPTPFIRTVGTAVTKLAGDRQPDARVMEPVFAPQTVVVSRKDWQGKQTLYSSARTNMALYSEDFTNAAWNKVNCTINANQGTAPQGGVITDTIIETATTASHGVYQQVAGTVPDNSLLVASFDVRPSARTICFVQVRAKNGTYGVAYFTLSGAGAVSNSSGIVSATIKLLPDGAHYRCVVTMNMGTGATVPEISVYAATVAGTPTYLGVAATQALFVINAQAEINSSGIGTAYIGPTTSAAVTVTDYTLNANGWVVLSTAPLKNAVMTWTGTFTGARKGFRALVAKMPDPKHIVGPLAGDVTVEFVGRDIQSLPELAVF